VNKIDVASLLWGAAGFLFLWAVKHFLDRAVLPRVLDWWARQTRKSALTRSEELLKLFKRDLGHASDIRYLILRVEEFVVVLVSASAIFNTGFLLLVTHPTVLGESAPGSLLIFLLAFLTMGFFAVVIWGVQYKHKRDADMFINLEKHREETVSRLRKTA
jgi:hypothetical protein